PITDRPVGASAANSAIASAVPIACAWVKPRSCSWAARGAVPSRTSPAWTNPGARRSPAKSIASGSRALAASSDPMNETLPSVHPSAVAKGSTLLYTSPPKYIVTADRLHRRRLHLCQRRRVSSADVKPLVLLDTPALYYRAFYSVPDSIVNDDGQPVNAVRGVLDAVAQMIRRFDTDRVVATMDADWRPAFRTAIMPEYKANRIRDEEAGTEIPAELAGQLPILNRVLTAAGIPIAEVDGTEADDVIATMAAQSRTPVVIVSPDRDLLALLDSSTQISVLRPRQGGQWEALTLADLPEVYGVPDGRRYRELAALRGDPSDGLPGAPGSGEKTAATLLGNFGSLDSIVKAAKAGVKTRGLSPKRAATIIDVEATLYKTLEVMRCLTDVDHGIDLESVPGAFDRAALARAAEGQNLRRSVDNLTSALVDVNAAAAVAAPAQAPAADPRTPADPTVDSSAPGHARPWTASRLVGFDLETTGVEPESA